MRLLDSLALAVFRRMDPERAHDAALWALEHGLGARRAAPDDPILATKLWDLSFPNPVGLAAGFDKDARVAGAALRLGFGFVEAGTVTPRPQPGNRRPRLFRLDEDEAVINRFGFNSRGLDPFAARLARRRGVPPSGVVGANVGKNRDTADGAADYAAGVERLAPHADYLVVNLSSPNTPGLRALQARGPIEDLLSRVLAARAKGAGTGRRPPLLAKVGPDLSETDMQDIAEVALRLGIDGLIVGNTTVARPPGLRSRHRAQAGGLSGRPLMAPSTECLSRMYGLTAGRIPLIGCGGVASGEDAYRKIRAGASLVQLYSALVFHGPALIEDIKKDLAVCLRRDGFSSVAQAAGA